MLVREESSRRLFFYMRNYDGHTVPQRRSETRLWAVHTSTRMQPEKFFFFSGAVRRSSPATWPPIHGAAMRKREATGNIISVSLHGALLVCLPSSVPLFGVPRPCRRSDLWVASGR